MYTRVGKIAFTLNNENVNNDHVIIANNDHEQ